MDVTNSEPEEKFTTTERQVKKPYIKPAFQYERVFVTTALTCGKVGNDDFKCHFNHKIS